ncbi:hypothetical protein JL722_15282 [Aureococcus anophagefferens]|nr:hypothetical protein JL722_15282 [Aureococcus anophagefferens]
MGTCASSEAQREAMLIDKMMEEELKKASVADEALVKLLILGAGESGKSTLFKQMKLMRGGGAAAGPRRRARRGRGRAPAGARAPRPADRRHGTPFTREEQHYMRRRRRARATLAANLPNFDIDIEVVDKAALATVLEADEDASRRARRARPPPWKLRGHVQIVESVVYFFEKIAELKRGDYVATVQDIMHAAPAARAAPTRSTRAPAQVRTRGRRAGPPAAPRTTPARRHGIVTSKYTIKGKDYEMYDVGGQRNERRKFEDETTNRMKDALDLFEEVCDNRHFSNVEANGFPDYAGKANDYADGVRYFTDKFLRKNKDPERTIFCHVTCATDVPTRVSAASSGVRAASAAGPRSWTRASQKKLESIGFM